MPERGDREPPDLPDPDDLIQKVSRELNINPDARPTWGDQEPIEQLYSEEAPTVDGRTLALECINELRSLVDISERLPEWRHEPVPIELLREMIEGHLAWARDHWEKSEPFPAITLTHLLGATKRQIAWLNELRHFEETEHFDGALGIYRSIRALIERAIQQADE